MNEKYEKIIRLPHKQSDTSKHKSLHDRAAQFAPYAALVGYGDVVNEAARLTEERIITDDSEIELLNRKLVYILSEGGRIEADFTYFEKDERKSGGAYITKRGYAVKFDETDRTLLFSDGAKIQVEKITAIEYLREDNFFINISFIKLGLGKYANFPYLYYVSIYSSTFLSSCQYDFLFFLYFLKKSCLFIINML